MQKQTTITSPITANTTNTSIMAKEEYKSPYRQTRRKSNESTTSATNSVMSSSANDTTNHTEDDHISYVSALTMDDALAVSDRLTLSDRYAYRLDPRLHSLAEKRMFEGMEELEGHGGLDDCSLPATNYNRFTDLSEGADTSLCPVPCRRLSLSYRSNFTGADLEHIKSSSSNLDLASIGNKSSSADLSYSRRRSSVTDYRSSGQWNDSSSFFLEEENLDEILNHASHESVGDDDDDSSAGSIDPLNADCPMDALGDQFDAALAIMGEDDPLTSPFTPPPQQQPRRSYRNKNNLVLPTKDHSSSTTGGYNRTGISSQSLDLFDVFGERCH